MRRIPFLAALLAAITWITLASAALAVTIDDANVAGGDRGSADCKVGRCGDGIVQPGLGEECELPSTPGCDAACHRVEICGNMVDDDGDGRVDC